jgi:hypothetical protein
MTFEEQEKRLRRLAGGTLGLPLFAELRPLSLRRRTVSVDSWNDFQLSGESIAIGRCIDYSIGTKDP